MKSKTGRILSIIVLVALFGARIYNAQQQKKAREKQQQMIYDLSRQQSLERMKNNQQEIDEIMEKTMNDLNLDSMRSSLDSLGKKIKKDQAEFQRKIDSIDGK